MFSLFFVICQSHLWWIWRIVTLVTANNTHTYTHTHTHTHTLFEVSQNNHWRVKSHSGDLSYWWEGIYFLVLVWRQSWRLFLSLSAGDSLWSTCFRCRLSLISDIQIVFISYVVLFFVQATVGIISAVAVSLWHVRIKRPPHLPRSSQVL